MPIRTCAVAFIKVVSRVSVSFGGMLILSTDKVNDILGLIYDIRNQL